MSTIGRGPSQPPKPLPTLPTAAEAGEQSQRVATAQPGAVRRPDGARTAGGAAGASQGADAAPSGPRRSSEAERERAAAASGAVQRGHKRRSAAGVELDDLGGSLPLPVDEVDERNWDQATLEQAEAALAKQMGLIRECLSPELSQGAEPGARIADQMVAHLLRAQPELAERLAADLASEAGGDVPALPDAAGVRASLAAFRGGAVGQMNAAEALLGAACVVVGHPEALPPAEATAQLPELLTAAQSVLQAGNGAVQSARRMNRGITDQLAVQRTFLFKKR